MSKYKPSLGLDIGTSSIVAARVDQSGNPEFKLHRDAFFEFKAVSDINFKSIKKGLEEKGVDHIIKDRSIFVVGEEAILLANERHQNVRRPLHRGVISAKEKDSMPMIKHIIEKLIGPPVVENEIVYYSVPGQPVDSAELNVTYHEQIFNNFLSKLGYEPHSLNEAEAIVYSELLDSGLTGVAMSFGAGMVNVCLCSMGDPVISFAVSRSGDYIDHETAIALDLTDSLVQAEKEALDDSGVPLLDVMDVNTNNKIYEGLSIHYGALLRYVLKQIVYELENTANVPVFKDPLPIVISGGTSMPRGFIDLFKKCLEEVDVPLPIGEIRHCKESLLTVAKGALFAATL